MVPVTETGADVVRLASPDVDEEELAELAAVVATGQLTMGPKVAPSGSLMSLLRNPFLTQRFTPAIR